MLDRPVTTYWGGALLGARKDQQDTFLAQELNASGDLLAIVADGMGGQAAGALASHTATKAFSDTFVELLARDGDLRAAFDCALRSANEAIYRTQAGHGEREGMGTTLLAVHLCNRGVSWISVGDSPLLLCRDQSVSRLNEDHSLRGLPEFKGGPHGNMLRSALTGQDITLVDVHVEPSPLHQGDYLLLASDGILTLDENDIIALLPALAAKTPTDLGQSLLNAVSQKGDPRQDNCTLIVIAASPAEPVRLTPPNPPSTVRVQPIWTIVLIFGVAIALLAAALFAWLG